LKLQGIGWACSAGMRPPHSVIAGTVMPGAKSCGIAHGNDRCFKFDKMLVDSIVHATSLKPERTRTPRPLGLDVAELHIDAQVTQERHHDSAR
jgi:hypothetical protein